jgi:hypothetical protein
MPPAPPAVLADVQDRLQARHQYLDNWFLAVRLTLGLGLIGYLTMDMLAAGAAVPVSVMLVVSYLLANLGVWLMMDWSFQYARWVFAGLDLTTFLLLRHLFHFEALVDPNATMVGLMTLMLIAYALYSDPRLSGALAVLALLATISTFVADALRLSPPSTSLVSSMLAYRSHPLRALILFAYLGTVGLVTHRLSQRLYSQVVAFSRDLWKAQHTQEAGDAAPLEAESLRAAHHDLAQTLEPLRTALDNLRENHDLARDPSMVGIAMASANRLHHLTTTVAGLSTVIGLHHATPERHNVPLGLLLDALVPDEAAERYIVRGARPLTVCLVVPPALYALRHLLEWGLRSTPDQHPITLRCRADANDGKASFITLTLHAPAFQLEPATLDAIDLLVEQVDETSLFPTTTHLDELLIRRALAAAGGSLDVVPTDEQETLLRCALPGRCPTAPHLDADAFSEMLSDLPHLDGVYQ